MSDRRPRAPRPTASRSSSATPRAAATRSATVPAATPRKPAPAPAATPRKPAPAATPRKPAPARTRGPVVDHGATVPYVNGAVPHSNGAASLNGSHPPNGRASILNGATRAAASPPPPVREPDVWDERVAGLLRFMRRRITGEYDVDEFGFDPDLTSTLVHPMLRLLYQRYFRVETTGVEHLPKGGALIVANHSGTLPLDAMMLAIAVHDETEHKRNLRLLGADLVFRIPVLSELARKAGSTLACGPDAERLLRNGEYVGVFPEGFKGIGKPYRDRYKLQRFGRGGFVSAALRTGTPIVPVSIVGAEEIYPIIGNVKPLAKVVGLPYAPVTPLFPWLGPLGMLPLPSKWLIEFGEPIETADITDDADDPIVVFNLADQVRETIQQTLLALLERRPDPFS